MVQMVDYLFDSFFFCYYFLHFKPLILYVQGLVSFQHRINRKYFFCPIIDVTFAKKYSYTK